MGRSWDEFALSPLLSYSDNAIELLIRLHAEPGPQLSPQVTLAVGNADTL